MDKKDRKIKEDLKIKELNKSWVGYIDDVFNASGESISLLNAVGRWPVLRVKRNLMDIHNPIAHRDWLTHESICLLHTKGTYSYHKKSD